MAKVDWITWKTDIDEIIKPDKINEEINSIFDTYNNYMNSGVYDEINHEVISGGLDRDSLNIVGVSPAYEIAINIKNSIDNIKDVIDELKRKINNSTTEQKQIEKNQLIEAINKKIAEENKILENTNILKEKILKSNNIIDINQVENIIENTKDKIKKLEERLEKAKEL